MMLTLGLTLFYQYYQSFTTFKPVFYFFWKSFWISSNYYQKIPIIQPELIFIWNFFMSYKLFISFKLFKSFNESLPLSKALKWLCNIQA